MKRKIPYLLMGLFLVIGLVIFSYPTISAWYNAQYQIKAVVGYDDTTAQLSAQRIQEELQRAEAYNRKLTGSELQDPFVQDGDAALPEGYSSILDVTSGIMGAVQIPKIDVNLPIYHGIGTKALEKGVGHMEMTAFPIGGEGNHAVLTGHTALPSAVLFSELDKMEEGDRFYIKIYNDTLCYQVDQIKVVEPTETDDLLPEPGMDYVTLVTCTPYAVNSHRLLVRGRRVFSGNGSQIVEEPYWHAAGSGQDSGLRNALTAAAAALLLAFALVVAAIAIAKRIRERKMERERQRMRRRRHGGRGHAGGY